VVGVIFGAIAAVCVLLGIVPLLLIGSSRNPEAAGFFAGVMLIGWAVFAAGPIAALGAVLSLGGRGNLRAAGLTLNLVALLPSLCIGGWRVTTAVQEHKRQVAAREAEERRVREAEAEARRQAERARARELQAERDREARAERESQAKRKHEIERLEAARRLEAEQRLREKEEAEREAARRKGLAAEEAARREAIRKAAEQRAAAAREAKRKEEERKKSPAYREEQARRIEKLARFLYNNGSPEKARQRLRELIRDYPETDSAIRAKALLREWES
jgi:TolA-binding protein